MLNKKIEALHKEFLQRRQKEKRYVYSYQLLLLIFFFAGWEVAARNQWIDPLIFSMPSNVFQLLIDRISDQTLLIHIGITLGETIIGFLIGTIGGTLIALLLWWSPRLSQVSDPYLVVLNSMPKVALGPIIIVLFGPNMIAIIAMGALLSIIITTIVVYNAFHQVDENYKKVLQTFGATKTQIFRFAVLPASYPSIISTLKVNVGLSWVGVIVGEFLVAKQGLGYLIIYGFQVFQFQQVMLSLLIIAFLATIMYQGVETMEKILLKNR